MKLPTGTTASILVAAFLNKSSATATHTSSSLLSIVLGNGLVAIAQKNVKYTTFSIYESDSSASKYRGSIM